MALVFKDRVKQKTTTVGSGDLTLIGLDADFQSFSQIGDGNDTYYTITSQNEWEVGVGTYNPSGVSSSWVQLGSDIDGEAAYDYSGYSVSLSSDGTIVAIGAYGNDGTGASAGHVRVYELSDQVWVQKGSDIDGEAADDRSGHSVSLNGDGTILAVGAIYNDDAGSNAGHVRIYEWSGSAWVQKGADIDGEAADDESGYSVSLNHDGTVVAIGAPYNDGTGSDAGHVRVYEWNGSAWAQKGADIDADSSDDLFGISVDINDDGTVFIAGATGGDGNGLNSGEIKVYEWNGSAWAQKGSTLSGESVLNSFGSSVSINNDGSVIAVGAQRNDGTGQWAGHVRVFYWDGSDWDQRGSDIDGEAALDYSGTQTALNGDGTVVAIGARDNDGTGSDAGHVRVYGWNGSAWVQLGADIDGEAADDESGLAVAISDDGTIVAIGAAENDGGGTAAGHVRTFVRSTLSRNTVLESSNLGNKISTTGTSTVFCTYPAEKSVYRNTNDQIVATASGIVFSDDSVQTTSPTLQAVTDLGSNTTNSIVTSGNITASTGIFDGGIQLVGALASVVSDLSDLGDVDGVWFRGEHDNAASGLTLGFNFPAGNHYYSTIRTTASNDIGLTRNRSLLLDCDTRKDTSLSSQTNSVCMVNAHNNQASLSNANLFGVYNAGDEKFVVTSAGSLRIASGIVFSDSTVQTTAAAVSGDNISIFTNDAGYLTTESDTLQTVTDRGSNTTNSIFTSGNVTATSGYFDTFDMTLLGDGSQPPHLEGRLFYDSENHTLTMYNDEPDVSMQIGQELYVRVRNNTPDDIPNGSVVRINGSHGGAAPTIVLASADSEENSQVAGFATHTIGSNSFGYISTFGLVRDVDTDGGMSDGDELFLSVTSGEYVNVDPGIPYYRVSLGRVVVSHASNGIIFVNIGKRKLSGGDLKSVTALNQSGVPFVTYIADTNAGGVTTVSDFVYDSGNNQLQLGSGVHLLNAVPGNTTNVLYNDGGTLKFNGSAVDTNTTYTGGTNLTLAGTTFNVDDAFLVNDADDTTTGTITAGGFSTTGNVGVGTETPVSAINLVGGSYVNEAVPASDTPTTEDATVTLDLSNGNYHNIVLGANVTKFEFTNAKRGQRFILRITQHASSAKTVSWSDVDSDTGGTAATVRWAGNITPTMSTTTSHTDVYGFLCTNNAGTNFDGFIIGQDLPD